MLALATPLSLARELAMMILARTLCLVATVYEYGGSHGDGAAGWRYLFEVGFPASGSKLTISVIASSKPGMWILSRIAQRQPGVKHAQK